MKVKIIINTTGKGIFCKANTELFDWPFPLPEKEDSFKVTEIEKITEVTFYQENEGIKNDGLAISRMREMDYCYYAYRNFRVSEENTPYIELSFEQIDE